MDGEEDGRADEQVPEVEVPDAGVEGVPLAAQVVLGGESGDLGPGSPDGAGRDRRVFMGVLLAKRR
ncbi:hypothetical protein [Kitasatospora griseola]|uniref:hypothetical protein n=1 Tax=Kitasatospora griseola TaxID=2064 RepID=UPI003665480A